MLSKFIIIVLQSIWRFNIILRQQWRETTGVMCDRNIPTKLKHKVYKTAIKPAMVYGAACWVVRKKEERKLLTTEMRMLRWAREKMRLDHVRKVDIWKETHMYPTAEFLREKMLRWFGHVQRQDKDDAKRKILPMTGEGESRQTKAEMARPGERGYGQKLNDVDR